MSAQTPSIAECTHFFKCYEEYGSNFRYVFLKQIRETATQQVFLSHEGREVRCRKGSGYTLQGRADILPVTPEVLESYRVMLRDAQIKRMISELSDFVSMCGKGIYSLPEAKREGLHSLLRACIDTTAPEPHAHKAPL